MTMLSTPLALTGLAPAHCRVWRIDLDQRVPRTGQALLSPAELERSQRFVFARDRHRYIAAHAGLRELLAQRTGRPGNLLDMAEGPFGKPALAGPAAAPYFNLSHSQGFGLVALSDTHEVGVDVEVMRPMADAAALARLYFTPGEQVALAHLESVDARAAERAFFVCWTRKEACLKALGLGLQLATESFEVGVGTLAGEPCELDIETLDGHRRLRLQSFDCGPGAVGAFALYVVRDVPHPISICACGPTHASKKSA